jgi:putative SOS response-associated peptidase YedK
MIITMAANDFMRPIHHRMPFIVSPQHYDWWMEVGPQNTLHLTAMNCPAEDALTAYAVSPRVNPARNDDVDCIKPA